MKKNAQGYFHQPEQPDMTNPNRNSVPNSCGLCGFVPEGKIEKDAKCPRCGISFQLNTLPDDNMIKNGPDESTEAYPSSFMYKDSKKTAQTFAHGLTPQYISQLEGQFKSIGLPVPQIDSITKILKDYKTVLDQQPHPRQETVYTTPAVPSVPAEAKRIKASDIIRKISKEERIKKLRIDIKNKLAEKKETDEKVEDIVEQLMNLGADPDDAKLVAETVLFNKSQLPDVIDKLAVWAEPPEVKDTVPPMAESTVKPIKKIRRKKKIENCGQ
jgi:hypothetical protein